MLSPSPIEHGRLSQITHTSPSQDTFYVPWLCGGLLLRDSLKPTMETGVKSRNLGLSHSTSHVSPFSARFTGNLPIMNLPPTTELRLSDSTSEGSAHDTIITNSTGHERVRKNLRSLERLEHSRRQLEGATLLEGGLQPHYFGSFMHNPFSIGALVPCSASRISHPEIPLGPLASRQLNS